MDLETFYFLICSAGGQIIRVIELNFSFFFWRGFEKCWSSYKIWFKFILYCVWKPCQYFASIFVCRLPIDFSGNIKIVTFYMLRIFWSAFNVLVVVFKMQVVGKFMWTLDTLYIWNSECSHKHNIPLRCQVGIFLFPHSFSTTPVYIMCWYFNVYMSLLFIPRCPLFRLHCIFELIIGNHYEFHPLFGFTWFTWLFFHVNFWGSCGSNVFLRKYINKPYCYFKNLSNRDTKCRTRRWQSWDIKQCHFEKFLTNLCDLVRWILLHFSFINWARL